MTANVGPNDDLVDEVDILTAILDRAQPEGLIRHPHFSTRFYAREILAVRDEEIGRLVRGTSILTPFSELNL